MQLEIWIFIEPILQKHPNDRVTLQHDGLVHSQNQKHMISSKFSVPMDLVFRKRQYLLHGLSPI